MLERQPIQSETIAIDCALSISAFRFRAEQTRSRASRRRYRLGVFSRRYLNAICLAAPVAAQGTNTDIPQL